MASAQPSSDMKWPRARGPHYISVMDALHTMLEPEWYLEIGVGRGNSLLRAKGKAIGVDPAFRLSGDVLGTKPELHLFRQTSDDFFASNILQSLTSQIDLAFIDGMHLFDYVLRDFMAVEKRCCADSVILLHDLVPFSAAAAEREWDAEKTKGWSGDVWKMIPILREYRPDLDFTVLDPRPSGLGMISNLDPNNRVLEDAYDEIIARFTSITIEEFGIRALSEQREMVTVSDVIVGYELESAT